MGAAHVPADLVVVRLCREVAVGFLRRQLLQQKNAFLSYDEVGGRKVLNFGEVPVLNGKSQALLRSGAKPGDDVYVSGTLGDARLALDALRGAIMSKMTALQMLCDHPQLLVHSAKLYAQSLVDGKAKGSEYCVGHMRSFGLLKNDKQAAKNPKPIPE